MALPFIGVVALGAKLKWAALGALALFRQNPLTIGLILLLAASVAWGWLQKARVDRWEALRLEEQLQAMERDRQALQARLDATRPRLEAAEREATARAAEVRRLRENVRALSARLDETLRARERGRVETEALRDKPLEEVADAFRALGLSPVPSRRPAPGR